MEQNLFADAADGRWDEHSLLTAALLASGVTEIESLKRYQSQVVRLAAELERSGKVTGPPQKRAQAVFEFLHGRILRGGYQLDCTALSLALDEGRYNCVSASVLFHCLATRFGLCVRGLETPGHAMCRLVLPDGPLDVETTCPGWFRLMDHPEKQAELVQRAIGARTGEGGSAAEFREVADVELVAAIYYNRGVDLLGENRFAEAAGANAKALRLDPSSATARGNLLATINNWAIDLGRGGSHAEAIGLLRQGIALDPNYETFRVNYVYLHSKWIEDLCRLGRFQEALELIGRATQDRVATGYFDPAWLDVYRRWARMHFEAGQTGRAFAVFEEAKRRCLDPGAVLEAEVAEVSRRAAGLLRQGRSAEAVALVDQALLRQPDSTVLHHNRRTAVMRWAQPAFQNGNYAEAIRRTTYGAIPGDLHQALVNNLRYGYHRWISQSVARGRYAEARRIAKRARSDPFLAGRTTGAIPDSLGN